MKQPFFSIIIPTYNRPQRLTKCLQSLIELDYPRERFEVIVVDDGSQISLEEIIAPCVTYINIILLRQQNSGPATARNTGAAIAKGQFLAFTDDDCTISPSWLTTLAARLGTSSNIMVGGHTVNVLTNNICSIASQTLIDYLYQYYNTDIGTPNFFTSNNFALATESFRSVGGFNTEFPLAAGEDREFCNRWLHNSYKMVYAPEILVYHTHELTLIKFWRQHFNYGRGAFHFHKNRIQYPSETLKIEPLSFYINLLTYPFTQTFNKQNLLIFQLFLLSQIANVTGFIFEIVNHKVSSQLHLATRFRFANK